MSRILGLDLGSYAVKALVVEAKGKATTPRAFAQVRRAQEGDRLDTLRAALAELKATGNLGQVDQVVVALPGPALATHNMALPFTDPKRLEAALPFEVEGQLPFDLSEAVFDYQPTSQKEKGTELLVGVVRKDELRALLGVLAEAGLDPRTVTHPGVAYQNVFLQAPELFPAVEGDAAVAVVDIGHERTSVAIGRPREGVEFARTFSGGGRELSRALAAEFRTPLPEAHQWKERFGALAGAAQGPDGERAAGALARGLAPVMRELRPSFKAYSARSRRPVAGVVLCGGTARIPGLAEHMTRELGVPVQLLELPRELRPAEGAEGVVPADVGPAAAQVAALALRGLSTTGKPPRFNLRRGEFAFKGDFDFVRERIGQLAVMAAVLLLLLISAGVVRNRVLAGREAQVDDMLCDVTKRTLGTCERNYDRALSMMRGAESPAAALPRLTAVNLLAELTARVPAAVPVRFERITVEDDRLQVQGEVDTSSQVDTLSQSLKGFRCFREVKEGKVEKTREGNRVSFRLDIQVECPAEAEG